MSVSVWGCVDRFRMSTEREYQITNFHLQQIISFEPNLQGF